MTELLEKLVVENTFVDYSKQLPIKRTSLGTDTRELLSDVVLYDILLEAVTRINPTIEDVTILEEAIEELTKDRLSKSLYDANKEVYSLLKNGLSVERVDATGAKESYHVTFVDWKHPENNSYHVKQQFFVKGKVYDKEPDIVYFVNGLPFVVVECKNSNQALSKAYDDNITDYLDAIPQLFVYNQFVVLTNGVKTKLGAFTSSYEHYYTRKKVQDEKETPSETMETVVNGVLDAEKLLDIVENFVLFDDFYRAKIVAKNHQYLGVNNVYQRFLKREEIDGKLGVFRHTQGSGKSYSMMWFVEKVFRKVLGNFTFVIVTDRTELDDQIAKGFMNCGISNEKTDRATSIAELKQLLQNDKKYIFTLIHKFDESFKHINERDDIIVITDEAHRSQYGDLAMWMRDALPNANFLGFTGTPLITEEVEPTKRVFGDYVSVYNFSQSIEDGATVPIYYDNYTPKVFNENPNLAQELEELQNKFSNADDDEYVDHRLSLAYAVLTRDDVLDEIAKHIAEHFLSRGTGSDGKAMVVCVNKKTAVKMYWKVQDAFTQLQKENNKIQVPDMGVMISLGDKQEEDRKMEDTGGDFSVLRKQIQEKDGDGTPVLEKRFKNPDDSLQIVFVCSMWLTGFDAKSCTTLYLQKPMNGHTLMQTIARTNRVYKDKTHGLIVDYVNIFSNLQKALSLYASPELGDPSDIIKNKDTFVDEIEKSLNELKTFLTTYEIDIDNLFDTTNDIRKLIDPLLKPESIYKEFFRLSKQVQRNYQALLPDPKAAPYTKSIKVVSFLNSCVKEALGDDGVSKQAIFEELEELLDRSIKVDEYKITQNFRVKDLSKIDYSKLKQEFATDQKNAIVQQLAKSMKETTEKMISVNPVRRTLMEKLEKIMEAYNKGSKEIEQIFEELIKLSQDITEEEQRAAKQEMSEEQLAVFDLLYKDDLNEDDKKEIKRIAKELLDIIKSVIESSVHRREKEQTQAEVKVKINDFLYEKLPTSYDTQLLQKKAEELYMYMYEHMRV